MNIRIILVILCVLFLPSEAKSTNFIENFCLQKVKAPDKVVGIKEVIDFQKSKHSLYFLGQGFADAAYLLEGNIFKSVGNIYPKNSQGQTYTETPDGKVIARTSEHYYDKPTPLYQQDNATGLFNRLQISNEEKLKSISHLAWSTPMGGVLLSVMGHEVSVWNEEPSSIFLLKDNQVVKVEGIEGWTTKIEDFPELEMTFLGTENEDRMYIMDGKQTVHKIGELNLGKWIYFNSIFHLKNPDRLLVSMSEALGPYRGLFLIQLENVNGTYVPKENQTYNNLWEKFDKSSSGYYNRKLGEYIINGEQYSDLIGINLRIFNVKKDRAPKRYKIGESDVEEITNSEQVTDAAVQYGTTTIDMPASNVSVRINKNGVLLRDKDEVQYLIGQDIFKQNYWIMSRARYIEDDKSVLIPAENGFFLLRDKRISGSEACTK